MPLPFRPRLWFNVQSVTETDDGSGGHTESWATFVRVCGQVLEQSVAEIDFADQAAIRSSLEVRVRYMRNTAITSLHRIVLDDGRTFKVTEVVNVDERNQFWDITAEAIDVSAA